ncbi:MAG: tetratricopeptide repeat protein [Chitinophagaceae bacterium]
MDRLARLEELLKVNPSDGFLQHAMALEYIKLGDDAKARSIFENILLHDPSYVGSYYHLGKLLERNGKKEEAISWYEKGMTAAKKAGDNHALGELRAAYDDVVD